MQWFFFSYPGPRLDFSLVKFIFRYIQITQMIYSPYWLLGYYQTIPHADEQTLLWGILENNVQQIKASQVLI